MKRISILLIFVTVICSIASAQSDIYVYPIGGNYAMKDLKSIQNDFLLNNGDGPIQLKKLQNFPFSLQVEAGYNYNEHKVSFGGYLNYATTAGRIGYSDYSGETRLDQNLKRFILGARAAIPVTRGLSFYGKVGGCYSLLDFEEYTKFTGKEAKIYELKTNSAGISIEPGFSYQYFYKRFGIGATVGYELNFQGKTFQHNTDQYLLNPDGTETRIDWSGARVAVGIHYKFKVEWTGEFWRHLYSSPMWMFL